MPILALLRHGQSQWNLENRFTGWVDVDLTAEGAAQAQKSGALMKARGLKFDRAYSSVLTRAIRTSEIALQSMDQLWIPLVKHWRLNERHYGGLTGLNKAETAWRRSYDIPPPPLARGGVYDFHSDPRYAGAPIPDTESLETTLERVLPYWSVEIAPHAARGETLLVAAHGNSIRAILKHLCAVPDDQIVGVEIPTGNPLLIELDAALKPTAARYLDPSRAQSLPTI
jgi:2,3-bisphosphoglycerate-dependent phosphoglycerate mutase